jgi:hypothetical protein
MKLVIDYLIAILAYTSPLFVFILLWLIMG